MRSSNAAVRGLAALVFALAIVAGTGVAIAQPAEDDPTADENGDTEPADDGTAGDDGAPADGAPADGAPDDGAAADGAADNPDEIPVNLRLRRLEQRVQALKERAWRAKARVGMLKEAVLGGGIGANATIVHKNKMGSSFRLIKLVYALDGTQIFTRTDDTGAMHGQKSFDVLTGPVAPGGHTISVYAVYRGHGYGVFKYLNKYTFKVRSSHTFTATEGKASRIEVVGFEKGGVTTPLEKRPAIDFKVSHGQGDLK